MNILHKIEEYIQSMKFKKKVFGGCDEADVLVKIRKLGELYGEQIEMLQKRLQETEITIQETRQQEEMIKQEYDRQIKQLGDLFSSLQCSKEDILRLEKVKVSGQVKQLEQEVGLLQQYKEDLTAQIYQTSTEAAIEMEAVRDMVENVRKKLYFTGKVHD